MHVRGQNVCSTLIPMSLPAGKEKHHDSRSRRFKHQLAAVDEGPLASTKFLPLFISLLLHTSLSLLLRHQPSVTSKTSKRRTQMIGSDWQWAENQHFISKVHSWKRRIDRRRTGKTGQFILSNGDTGTECCVTQQTTSYIKHLLSGSTWSHHRQGNLFGRVFQGEEV